MFALRSMLKREAAALSLLKKSRTAAGVTLTISALNCLHTIRSERNGVGDRTR